MKPRPLTGQLQADLIQHKRTKQQQNKRTTSSAPMTLLTEDIMQVCDEELNRLEVHSISHHLDAQ